MSGVVEIEDDVEASPSPQPSSGVGASPSPQSQLHSHLQLHPHPHTPSLQHVGSPHVHVGSPHYPSPVHQSSSPYVHGSPAAAQQLRQRNVAAPAPSEPVAGRLARSLKTLDIYPKMEEDTVVRTGSGGLLSLLSFGIIALLLLTQLWAFLVPREQHTIRVDTRPAAKIPIHFDITFHALRCSDTSIDVMDSSGASQVAVSQNIRRVRLDAQGRRIEASDYEDHAHHAEGEAAARPNPALNPMLQTLGLAFPQQMQGGPDAHVDQRGEGCRVVGMLLVNRVAGNVHIALGGAHGHAEHDDKGKHGSEDHGHGGGHGHDHGGHFSPPQQSQPAHVHQFPLHELASYNCSHTITHLRFGDPFPGAVFPLDGARQIIPWGSHTAHIQYFVKIIPTRYEDADTTLDTNQFSFTQHTQLINVQDAFAAGGQQKIPGVFFVYDLSPFLIRVSSKRMPWSSFVTSLLAVMGGVLTVAGVLDSLLYAGAKIAHAASPRTPNKS